MHIDQIQTPALVVDLDTMEDNLRRMADVFQDRPANLRPHFKNHKVPQLACKQIRAGAVGITCATVREAQILIEHGVDDILIANEIAGAEKVELFAELSGKASLLVGIDSRSHVVALAEAGKRRAIRLQVLVDIDTGLGRCGVAPGQEAVDLACYAVAEGLVVRGVTGYEGHLQALQPGPERDTQIHEVCRGLVDTKDMMIAAGIPADIVSTGGTGTCSIAGQYPGITEIQAGSYLLMDTQYKDRGVPFQRALTLLASVISVRGARHAVIDCGVKALSAERGLSTIKELSGIKLKALHAEHGLLELETERALQVGQRIELWVHYSDATVNLHSKLYGVRHGQIEEIFDVAH